MTEADPVTATPAPFVTVTDNEMAPGGPAVNVTWLVPAPAVRVVPALALQA